MQPNRIMAAACAVVLASLCGTSDPVAARGGHFGFHGGRVGGFVEHAAPVYVVIDVSEVADPEAFNTLMANMPATLLPYGGRLIVRSDAPTALAGTAPARLVVIAFDTREKAQAWNDSDAAKQLYAGHADTIKARSFLVDGLPDAAVAGGRGHRIGFDPKPFEAIIKKRDEDLKRVQDICKGC